MLGPTVEAIAREKAAIVSPGGTLVAALAHGSPTSGVAASVARAPRRSRTRSFLRRIKA